ncbi:C45 family autoproteolytic acyltransferase/hydrolase [Leucobacter sp. Z1108]|uniref:C45 family autoproteolytic acyltransferase/hydolase n=1 Tax=Leucobacter sp. Z1108 TaxID=3439066 RepID=UPI003F400D3F
MTLPRIRISGSPAERSEQYGRLAREQILHIRAGYEHAFAAKGTSWEHAVDFARQFLPFIDAHASHLRGEMEGIAAGSGLSFDEILTLNCRSEILYAATVRTHASIKAGSAYPAMPLLGECSAMALEGDRTSTGQPLVAQNWDWLEALGPGVILLEVEREDGPNYVTLVEAGLLAKMSMNAHGVAMGITTLASTRDGTPAGLPFHVLIRMLTDAPHVSAAVEMLASVPRATGGNFMLATATGAVLNIETSPGAAENISPQVSLSGALVHTNHFLDPVPGGADLAALAMPDSFVRYGRLCRAVDQHERLSHTEIQRALSDHGDFPNSICCHPDVVTDPRSRWATLASVVMHPKSRALEVAQGTPCSSGWDQLDYSELLAAT